MIEEGPRTPLKDVSEIDPIKNNLQINDGMAENFADQTLIDDGNDEFFASLDLADEEKSEEKSSKHFSNILPMTSTYPNASLNKQQPDSLDLADVEKSEEKSSKHFSNILPMTSTYPNASLNKQQPDHEIIFWHNSYNPQCTFM
jgi:hypothetical protein